MHLNRLAAWIGVTSNVIRRNCRTACASAARQRAPRAYRRVRRTENNKTTMPPMKLERWDWACIVICPVAAGLLWLLVRTSAAAEFAIWVALGPIVLGVVAYATARWSSLPSRVMRISLPVALIWNVVDVWLFLYHPSRSTSGLGVLIGPAIGVVALLFVFPLVWAADWFYRAMLAGVASNRE